MRARSHPEVASLQEAHALLGLTGPAEGLALTTAFRTAIKAARPGQPGGDEDRFRKVIAAWRLIRDQAEGAPERAAPAVRAPSPPVIAISPLDALNGGAVTVALDGRTFRVRVPKGVRSGDRLRLKGAGPGGASLQVPVLIRAAGGLTVLGDDLYLDCPVSPRLLEEGGRLEIETHAGRQAAWIVAGQETLRLRLKGLGLPARGERPEGHLFVALKPSAEAPSAAEDMLERFTRVWTPDRLAA